MACQITKGMEGEVCSVPKCWGQGERGTLLARVFEAWRAGCEASSVGGMVGGAHTLPNSRGHAERSEQRA